MLLDRMQNDFGAVKLLFFSLALLCVPVSSTLSFLESRDVHYLNLRAAANPAEIVRRSPGEWLTNFASLRYIQGM
jgi:hypothetical protein